MKIKDLKINFRYLGGNIACLSVDSIDGESVHNDINNEEAIIIFNSLVGEKENCQTVKTLLKENQELKEKLDKYENPEDMTLMMMWCTEKVKDENEKLKEKITNLSKDVDMWNAKYNEVFDENKRLKEVLETKSYCKYANKCDELNDCSREEYEDMANANVRLKVENCDLKEENQELKLELSGYRQAILNNKEMLGLKEQNAELKKQLENYKKLGFKHLQDQNVELNKKYENAVADYETTMAEKEQLNSLVNSCQEEIRQLKEQLEEWEHHLKCSKEMLDIQGQKGNYDYDEYMLGLYNGMEYIISLFETREPNFINGKDVEFTNNKIQQKKFIKWLEDYINLFDKKDIYEEGSCDMLEEILQKYRSIIGDDK